MTKPGTITLCGLAIAAATFLLDSPAAEAGFCFGCGSNAATLGDNAQFEELNLNHLVRGDGPKVRFRGAFLNGSPVPLKVDHDMLQSLASGVYAGTAIQNLTIDLTVDGGASYQIKLFEFKVECPDNAHECAGLWYWAAPHTFVPHYVFRVRKVVEGFPDNPKQTVVTDWRGNENFLCRAERDPNPSLTGSYKNSAIIFIGDQYDPKRKAVAKSDKHWFNLACAGTAIYKMHMLRHTEAGKTTGKSTDFDQRTAMLKAIVADYCGDGKAWTGDGTPLDWTDAQAFFPDPPLPNVIARKSDVEAIWSKNGALCLNIPRRLPKIPNPSWGDGSNCTDPAVRRWEVVAACGLERKKPFPGKLPETSPSVALPGKPPTPGAATPKPRNFVPVPRFPLTIRSPLFHIPECGDKWIETWNDPDKRAAAGAYAVTLNVTKDANYCDPLP
jgi:hypothetical protein